MRKLFTFLLLALLLTGCVGVTSPAAVTATPVPSRTDPALQPAALTPIFPTVTPGATRTPPATVPPANTAYPPPAAETPLPTGTPASAPTPSAAASIPPGSPTPQSTSTGLVPALDHILLIVFENHNYAEIIGNQGLANFNRLADENVLFTQYYAVAHPSLPNYLALIGGSTFGISSDCMSCFVDAPNLADRLEAGW